MQFFKSNTAPSLFRAALLLPALMLSSVMASDLNEETSNIAHSSSGQPLRGGSAQGEASSDLLSRLPYNLNHKVLSYLTREEYGRLACVSKGWHKLSKDHLFPYYVDDRDMTLKAPPVNAKNIQVIHEEVMESHDLMMVQKDVQYGPYKIQWSAGPFIVGPEYTMEIPEPNPVQGRHKAEIHFGLPYLGKVVTVKRELLPSSIEGFDLPTVSIEQLRSWAKKHSEVKKNLSHFESASPLIWSQEGTLRKWKVYSPSIKSEESYQEWLRLNGERVNRVSIGAPEDDGEGVVHSALKSLNVCRVIPMGDGTYGTCFMSGNFDLKHLLYYSWRFK
ncbi:MAG: F-box protein [Holosporales bacterium]